jgi:hypothetical protein
MNTPMFSAMYGLRVLASRTYWLFFTDGFDLRFGRAAVGALLLVILF